MPDPEARVAFLAACACIAPDPAAARAIHQASNAVDEWGEVVWLADEHGLTPLIRRHARALSLPIPPRAYQQLTASALRHRNASQLHADAVVEISRLLGCINVPHVVLKGAVLAFDIYPEPELRPRRDIDLLVRPADCAAAVTALKGVGFSDSSDPQPRGAHHHLPALVRERDGLRVSVEVHTNAISHDQPDVLTMAAMTQPPRSVEVNGIAVPAFGHVDMLRHLTAHLLEPGEHTRLISVVDVLAYCVKYHPEIDWAHLRREWPRVVNTIALLHYLVPLPAQLAALRPPDSAARPQGAGVGFSPLGSLRRDPRQWLSLWSTLLYPSPWWMHAYYGVPPGRSLAPTRWLRHAPRVAYWTWRRVAER